MQFFIRAYGVLDSNKSSKDIFKSEFPISNDEFIRECNKLNAKKFLLCVRGRGIKGFKKLDEYVAEEELEVFNAETISVNQKLTLDSLSDGELLNLMDNMVKNAPMDSDGQDKFMADLKKFNAEIRERSLIGGSQKNAAEDTTTEWYSVQEVYNVKLQAESIIPPKKTADERFMAEYNMLNNRRN